MIQLLMFIEYKNLYIDEFSDGHRRRGMAQLRIPERDEVNILIY
jgi:hypothetical protein